jgi:hypothetical protein
VELKVSTFNIPAGHTLTDPRLNNRLSYDSSIGDNMDIGDSMEEITLYLDDVIGSMMSNSFEVISLLMT